MRACETASVNVTDTVFDVTYVTMQPVCGRAAVPREQRIGLLASRPWPGSQRTSMESFKRGSSGWRALRLDGRRGYRPLMDRPAKPGPPGRDTIKVLVRLWHLRCEPPLARSLPSVRAQEVQSEIEAAAEIGVPPLFASRTTILPPATDTAHRQTHRGSSEHLWAHKPQPVQS
jgi:hypothetical protein